VFLFGPDANRAVLLDRDGILSSREPWMLIMGTIFPNGLLLRDGAEHRHHRKIMHETFKRPVLREYVERMNPAIHGNLARWPGGGRLHAFDAFKALTLDIAASIFVGVDLGRESRRMNEAFEAMVAAAMPGPRFPFFGRHHRGVVGRRFMLELLGGMLEKKRGDAGGDLFSRLCRARSETGEFFSDADVLDHMVFLMMAAHDTTTSTLTSLTWELAKHPEWQERIREESFALGEPFPDFDALDRLDSLTFAMQETLRRYPPLPVIPRTTLRDFEWEGYRIPAGTMVVVSPIHTHYMPEWWDAPERFDPERFGPARAEHERHTHSWIPFGGGTHMCIGRRFAEAQVRLVAHQLVRRYRWSVPAGYQMPVQQAPISKPVDGLPIDLEALA
jgi:cytochrome P450